MSTSPSDAKDSHNKHTASPQKSSVRSLLLLLVATSALLVFIVGVGDFRRKQNAIAQMEWHCGTYTSRMGDTGTLPLNFEPDIAVSRRLRMLKVFWLTREDARALRGISDKIIVAYTAPIPRALAANGRAVAYFKDGAFTAAWLEPDAFDKHLKKQQDAIRALAAASGG